MCPDRTAHGTTRGKGPCHLEGVRRMSRIAHRYARIAALLVLVAVLGLAQPQALGAADAVEITVTNVVDVIDLFGNEIWLAGLTVGPEDGAAEAFALRWELETSTWFPTWNLMLVSEAGLLPGGDTSRGLGRVAPLAGHTYEVTLSYSSVLNGLAIRILDRTEGRVVYSDAFEVAPYEGELYAASGSSVPYYIPVGSTWAAGTVTEGGQFLPLTQYNSRGESASIRLTTPAPLPVGEYRFYLEAAGEKTLLASVQPQEVTTWIPIPLADLPLGASTIHMEYVDRGQVLQSDSRQINLGRIDFWIDPVTVERADGVVKATVHARAEEAYPDDVELTLTASLYELVWDETSRNFVEELYAEDVVVFADRLDLLDAAEQLEVDIPLPAEAGNWRLRIGAQLSPAVAHSIAHNNRVFSTHRPAEIGPGDPYTFIVFPDTQYFAQNHPHIYLRMTDWVTANAYDMNIAAVLHMGDITNNNAPNEWENAFTAMSLLHDVVPYVLAIGNHDMTQGGGQVAERGLTRINQYFSVDAARRYSNLAGTMTEGSLENHYSLFSVAGDEYVVISLEFGPPNEALEWANQVADQYPDRRLILITHSYLSRNGNHSTSPLGYPIAQNRSTTVNAAGDIWNRVLRNRANSFMVLSGHTSPDEPTIPYRTPRAATGQIVYELLFDWQNQPNGGNGWLGILTFLPDNTVEGRVFSPFLGEYAKARDPNGFTSYIRINLDTGFVQRLTP